MRKRVLILSTSAGSGHKVAASALEKVFCRYAEVEQVVNKDALELTNEAHRSLYSKVFLELVQKYPRFLGWWYDESDEPWKTDDMRLMLDRLNAEPLVKFIKHFDPDITVCTHFMPAGIISHLLSKKELHTILSIVTTDYDFHSMWLSQLFHRYFVALDETKAHLIALGLPESHITVSGIPVDPAFSTPVHHADVLAKYDLRPDKPVLLLSAGTFGNSLMKTVVEQFLQLRHDVQTVIICGKNRELRRDIEVLVAAQPTSFRVLGYTHDIANLMKIATLFIGKPGGLTSSECMAVGLPMVICMPIPGQEERNSDHLLEKGAAIKCNDLTVVAYKIDKLLDDPDRLQQMRINTRRLGQPHAAQIIAETLLKAPDISPMYIDKETRQRMAEAARGTIGIPHFARPQNGEQVLLYDAQTGVLIGVITKLQLQFLLDHLEEENEHDDDYYINQATVEMLEDFGASAELLTVLQKAIAGVGEADIRWVY